MSVSCLTALPRPVTTTKGDTAIKSRQPLTRVNDQIRASQVRLVTSDGNQAGVVPLEEALRQAQVADLDLVEVAPMADPPVCKILDHGKVLFDQRRRQKLQKKKQHQSVVKEVKLKLKIDKHDYWTKLKRARKFLIQGDKVKFTILFRGREVTHQEIGRNLTSRILEDMSDMGELEGMVSRSGRMHTFMVSRRKDYHPPVEEPSADATA